MTIFDQLKEDIKTAMKSGDKDATQILRFVMAEIKKEAVDTGSDRENITDEVSLKVLEKAVKSRRESIKVYNESNRTDLAATEEAELEVIKKYLPAELSDFELQTIIARVKAENPSIQGPAIMGKLMPHVKGKADPDRIKKALGL